MRMKVVAVVVLATTGVASAQPASGDEDLGFAFVDGNCSQCHAVGPAGESPVAGAPPFRDLGEFYPVEALAEALAEGIVTGHPAMPQFVLEPDQIADVIAYLRSIQTAPAE